MKHGEAERIVNTYQESIADRGLMVEQKYLNHSQINYNTRGSVRLDVYDTVANQIYDYKFVVNPGRGLSARQKNKIIRQGPAGLTSYDIHEVNPK